MLRATKACTFSTSQLPKVVRAWCVLYILTSKCASRHNGVHFFDVSTSKRGLTLRCFVHFDLEKCFASQCRTFFRHNAVHFFDITTSKSGPSMVCFVDFDFEMCFGPQRRAIFHFSSGQHFLTLQSYKSLEKHNVWRLSYLFAHLYLLSSDSFSSLIFSLLLFSSL